MQQKFITKCLRLCLSQNAIVLFQNATQLLYNVSILLQNATVIRNCLVCYKMRRYKLLYIFLKFVNNKFLLLPHFLVLQNLVSYMESMFPC